MCSDKKENKIFLTQYIRKFRVEQLQSHILYEEGLPDKLYEEMRKYFPINYMRRPLVIYDFATSPF
jgi:hypothetical protein